MSSSSKSATTPRGKVVRGRDASATQGLQRPAVPMSTVGGLQLDTHVAAHLQEEAHREGFEAGYADGMRAAERAAAVQEVQHQQAVEAVRRTFGDAHTAFERALADALTDLEDALATASIMLAESIIGREVQLAENPGKDAIARALALAPQHFPVIAHCHPDDVERIGDVRAVFGDRDIAVLSDATVAAGGCILHVGRTEIDAQLASAVERARKALCG